MPKTSVELWKQLGELYSTAPQVWPVVEIVVALAREVDALRTALSDPRVPEPVRLAYREAYAAASLRSHDAGGPTGGWEKTLRRLFPLPAADGSAEDLGELALLERLGLSADERARHQARLREVEMNT